MKTLLILLCLCLVGCDKFELTRQDVEDKHGFTLQNYPARLIAIEQEKQTLLMQEIVNELRRINYDK